MQQVPPTPPAQPQAQPHPPPQRPGWGRFWLGVLTGGCAVLVLEVLAGLILTLVLGIALGSAFGRATGSSSGPLGLPGGLPASLPGLTQSSDPCAPQPCVAHGGVTVLVGQVDRNAGPSASGGAHLVRVNVTFQDTAGTHTVTPEELALRDSSGSLTLPDQGALPTACGATDPTSQQDIGPGQSAGPYTVCYSVSGSTSAPLTLVWINPSDLALVEVKLP